MWFRMKSRTPPCHINSMNVVAHEKIFTEDDAPEAAMTFVILLSMRPPLRSSGTSENTERPNNKIDDRRNVKFHAREV